MLISYFLCFPVFVLVLYLGLWLYSFRLVNQRQPLSLAKKIFWALLFLIFFLATIVYKVVSYSTVLTTVIIILWVKDSLWYYTTLMPSTLTSLSICLPEWLNSVLIYYTCFFYPPLDNFWRWGGGFLGEESLLFIILIILKLILAIRLISYFLSFYNWGYFNRVKSTLVYVITLVLSVWSHWSLSDRYAIQLQCLETSYKSLGLEITTNPPLLYYLDYIFLAPEWPGFWIFLATLILLFFLSWSFFLLRASRLLGGFLSPWVLSWDFRLSKFSYLVLTLIGFFLCTGIYLVFLLFFLMVLLGYKEKPQLLNMLDYIARSITPLEEGVSEKCFSSHLTKLLLDREDTYIDTLVYYFNCVNRNAPFDGLIGLLGQTDPIWHILLALFNVLFLHSFFMLRLIRIVNLGFLGFLIGSVIRCLWVPTILTAYYCLALVAGYIIVFWLLFHLALWVFLLYHTSPLRESYWVLLDNLAGYWLDIYLRFF